MENEVVSRNFIEIEIDKKNYADYEHALDDFAYTLEEIEEMAGQNMETTESEVGEVENYIGKIAEIINTEDEDLNNFIEDFYEKHKSKSLFVSITNQEDDNLWGEIIGTDEPLPYHFEIKDVACFY